MHSNDNSRRWNQRESSANQNSRKDSTRIAHLTITRDGVTCDTPYDKSFVETLKRRIPRSARKWDAGKRLWTIEAGYLPLMLEICGSAFDDVVCHDHVAETSYDRLFVRPGAPPAVIDAAYKALARTHHPDVSTSPDAVSAMQRINAAYEQLRRSRS